MISNKKRRQNLVPQSPPKSQRHVSIQDSTINEQLSAEENTEGSESESPAYNPTSPPSPVETMESYPTSPPSTVGTTESSGNARTQGPRTTLEFTPVRELEPAVDSNSEERTDISMFIAPVVMNSAQVAQPNWMVDSGAGMSGTSSTISLKDTMRCRIPITPAFGEVMNATSEGLISDPTFKKLRIKAIHIEGIHHNLLSVHQVCTGGESGEEQVGVFPSEGRQVQRGTQDHVKVQQHFLWTGERGSICVCSSRDQEIAISRQRREDGATLRAGARHVLAHT